MKKYVGKRVYVQFNRKTFKRDGEVLENLNNMGYKKTKYEVINFG